MSAPFTLSSKPRIADPQRLPEVAGSQKVDNFKAFGLTPTAASHIGAVYIFDPPAVVPMALLARLRMIKLLVLLDPQVGQLNAALLDAVAEPPAGAHRRLMMKT